MMPSPVAVDVSKAWTFQYSAIGLTWLHLGWYVGHITTYFLALNDGRHADWLKREG